MQSEKRKDMYMYIQLTPEDRSRVGYKEGVSLVVFVQGFSIVKSLRLHLFCDNELREDFCILGLFCYHE